jgi:UDP-N-acetylmuramoyl-tripeptide--D-alanyl-D-alanine ligase
MGELGAWAEEGHRQVGAYAAGKVDALYAVGPLMAHAVAAFGSQGRHFADQASLLEVLRGEQDTNTTILIKGSRSAAMDRIVSALCGTSEEIH